MGDRDATTRGCRCGGDARAHHARHGERRAGGDIPRAGARGATALLTVAFSCQAAIYYGLSTWLPTIAADQLHLASTRAAGIAAIFQAVGVVGAFVFPGVARIAGVRATAVVLGGCFLVLTIGLVAAAAGPALGLVHDLSRGWAAPLGLLVVVAVVYTVTLTAATSRAARW